MTDALRTRSRESSISDTGSSESVVERSPRGRFCRFNRQLISEQSRGKRVYLAFDSDTGREVAWTVLPSVGRTPSEIEWIKNLDHPRIVKVLNAWVNLPDEEVVYISERVAGCSLRQYIARLSGNLKSKIIKLWVKQILEALVYLHSSNYVHRTISCGSIFVNAADGSVLLGDLSLAMETSAADLSTAKVRDLRDLADSVLEMATRKVGVNDPEILNDLELKMFVTNLKFYFASAQEALLSSFFDSTESTTGFSVSPRDSPSRRLSLESVPEAAPITALVQTFRDTQKRESIDAKNKLATEIARHLRISSDSVKRFIL